jgi:S1-C subfamily serine protease
MTTYPVRLPAKFAGEQGATEGLMVLGVQPEGPADEAGLLLGDTLLTLGGRPIQKPDDLKQQLAPESVGRRLEARVLRAGETLRVTVEVGNPGARERARRS